MCWSVRYSAVVVVVVVAFGIERSFSPFFSIVLRSEVFLGQARRGNLSRKNGRDVPRGVCEGVTDK